MTPVYDYWFWYDLRLGVLERDGSCAYCQSSLTKYTVTLDHVIPKSAGGSDDLDNLVACCKSCNTLKGAMPLDEFLVVKSLVA